MKESQPDLGLTMLKDGFHQHRLIQLYHHHRTVPAERLI